MAFRGITEVRSPSGEKFISQRRSIPLGDRSPSSGRVPPFHVRILFGNSAQGVGNFANGARLQDRPIPIDFYRRMDTHAENTALSRDFRRLNAGRKP
jgi:hypothetical protein